MFKAQIDWRDVDSYGSVIDIFDGDSNFTLLNGSGTLYHHIAVQISIVAFRPFLDKQTVLDSTDVKKKLFGGGKKSEHYRTYDAINAQKSCIYVFAPLSSGYSQFSSSELKEMVVDVPYEALQHLSVIAEKSAAVIDLTSAGQQQITKAFQDKAGVFSPETEMVTVIDPTKSLVDNGVVKRIIRPQIL